MLFINILNFCLFLVDCRNSKRISTAYQKTINDTTNTLQAFEHSTSNKFNDTMDLDLNNKTLEHRNIVADTRVDLNHSSINNSSGSPHYQALASATVIPPTFIASAISTGMASSTSDRIVNEQESTFDKLNIDLLSASPIKVANSDLLSASPIKVANSNLVSSASLDSNAQDTAPLLDDFPPSLVASTAESANTNDDPTAFIESSSGNGKSNSSNHTEYTDGNTSSPSTQRSNTSTYIVIAGTGSLFLVGMLALYEKKAGRFSTTPSLHDGDLSFYTGRKSMISQLEPGLEQPIASENLIPMPPLKYLDNLDLYSQDDPSRIYAELYRASMVGSILEPGPAYVPGRIFGNNISTTQGLIRYTLFNIYLLASWSDAFMEELTGFESESRTSLSLSSHKSDESEDVKHLVHYLDIKHIIDMELN